MECHPPLAKAIHRYVYVLMAQQASAAACMRSHQIGPRVARWLLMSQDRAHSPSFHITHEFLGYMLGVRRVGITNAATALQRAGLIEYRRGEMHILDLAACSNLPGCSAADLSVFRVLPR